MDFEEKRGVKKMNWLTTGQMIEQISVGDKVERKSDGAILVYCNHYYGLKFENSTDTLSMTAPSFKEHWRILPKYVSFEEAMKAVVCGRGKVYWHFDGSKKLLNQITNLRNDFKGFCLEPMLTHLIKGKFTIE
jgi:hypothetical protein